VPGRHAARDEKRSTGPLALGASRAPGRNLGLGRESLILRGLKLGPVSVSRPSKSDGCVRFPAEQNRARLPRATLALILIFSAPTRAPQRRLRATERRRRERARGAARAPRRSARSPLDERATVEWPQRRFYRRAAAPSRSGADPQRERRQDLGPDHMPTSGGRVLPAQPVDPRPMDLRSTVTTRRSR
jgi:hypothetical protein